MLHAPLEWESPRTELNSGRDSERNLRVLFYPDDTHYRLGLSQCTRREHYAAPSTLLIGEWDTFLGPLERGEGRKEIPRGLPG